MPTDANPASVEKRLFSDQLMLEMGHALVDREIITRAQLDELMSRKALTGESLDKMLVKEKIAGERQVLEVLSELTNMPFRHIADLSVSHDAVTLLQPRAALRFEVLPVMAENGVITLATRNIPDQTTADSLRMLLNQAVEWILCMESDIAKSIKHFYGLGAETIDDLVQTGDAIPVEIDTSDVTLDEADEGIIKFVNQIIGEAIAMKATDIHMEPFRENLILRFRVDGILQNVPVPKGVEQFRRALASCVKIMADLNIAEKRKPHDGRIKVRRGTEEFDLRVSILPTPHGETVNMRILNAQQMFIDLSHLGLAERQMIPIRALAELPHGVILVTGPTGSGKTTTLYALLSHLTNNDVKIITVEEPIEYQINGISQIQVHQEIGLTFASILRSILRHDPDIVLIGEIRDSETADIAVRASLTGHLVFSTLHTNDAPSAVTRLIDMGIEPFLVSSCLEGAIAQRLVRRLCSACRVETTVEEPIMDEIRSLYPDRVDGATLYAAQGCPDCSFTGYSGRIGLFEIMVINDALRSTIVQARPSNEIQALARENGMVTLREDGWSRVLDGMTSVEEVFRVARKADS
jgi:type II secretory ATPase GspE/PulE/Tfp pilus assembly ATPase PilB-like protein